MATRRICIWHLCICVYVFMCMYVLYHVILTLDKAQEIICFVFFSFCRTCWILIVLSLLKPEIPGSIVKIFGCQRDAGESVDLFAHFSDINIEEENSKSLHSDRRVLKITIGPKICMQLFLKRLWIRIDPCCCLCSYEFQMQYGSIGWSVGAVLGYAQASPERRVIACIGDGSFQVQQKKDEQ